MDDDRAQVDLLRRRVVNVVGHELRTPITTLRGLAEMLGTTKDLEETRALHDAIRRAARRVEALVDDLLVGTGVTTALPVGEPRPTEVAGVVAEAWSSVEDLPPGFELAVAVPTGLAVLVHPRSWRRALHAVLENAVRHGAPPVAVEASVDGDTASIAVSDRGPGIPQAERALAHEAFFRGERAVTTGPGLGLGLALATDLVVHDGGSLTVGPGDPGTVVVIRLPVVVNGTA